jgi:hypothetical protein
LQRLTDPYNLTLKSPYSSLVAVYARKNFAKREDCGRTGETDADIRLANIIRAKE